MNSLIRFKTTIHQLLIALALTVVAALTAVPARATPSCAVATEFIVGSAVMARPFQMACST